MMTFFIFIGLFLGTASFSSDVHAGDFMPYSLNPPAGLKPDKVPQFVTIGSDDNGYSGINGSNGKGGMKWILDLFRNRNNPNGKNNPKTFDGRPCRMNFFITASLGDRAANENKRLIKKMWRLAWQEGHEIGNHSYSHSNRLQLNTDERVWKKEIDQCNSFLASPYHARSGQSLSGIGIDPRQIYGFRTPFLTYTYETFSAIKKKGFLYDCSIEDGWQDDQNGSNFCWPYTLDNGSPGDNWNWDKPDVHKPRPIGRYAGLWEVPLHPLIAPSDTESREYAFPPGLHKKIKKRIWWFDEADGKIPSFDYNLFCEYNLKKEEVLAILKHSFDLHYNGNRAPFQLGVHADIYSSKYPINKGTLYQERQWVIEQFIDYILTKPDTRIVTNHEIIAWCRKPAEL